MTVTIGLRPEIEAGPAVLANVHGVSLTQYVRRLLEEQIAGRGETALFPVQRAALWRESVKGLPHTTPLSDEAISRDRIYNWRG